jgi:hypothetical protein
MQLYVPAVQQLLCVSPQLISVAVRSGDCDVLQAFQS